MKKIIFLLAFIFIISFASAEIRVYDYCNDSIINTTLWNYTSVTVTYASESSFLHYRIYKDTAGSIYGNLTSLALPNLIYIKNITFNATLIANISTTGETASSKLNVFGNEINSVLAQWGSGFALNTSIYTLKKNSSVGDHTFDVFINNVRTTQINASNNVIKGILDQIGDGDAVIDNADIRINNVTYFYEEPDVNFTGSSYETSRESFNLTITSVSSPTGIYLNYSNTLYSGSSSLISGNNYLIYSNIDIPSGSGIKSFNFLYNNGTNQKSANHSQLISTINFSSCDSEFNVPFINYTFKNETTGMQSVSASVSTSSFNYYLGSGTVNKTYTFSNTTQASSRAFCFSPSSKTIYTSENVNYYNTESLQRTYQSASTTLTNTTTSTTLWLLPTSAGIYVSFQVVDGSIQPLENALVTISRSGYGTIGIQFTDASGLATFFLDPLATYTVSAYKSGYTTFSESIIPTQTSYTINLGSGSLITTPTDFTKGISYSFLPVSSTLTNGTTYNFTFNLDSSYYTIASYGFNITNSTGTSLGYNSSSTEGNVTLQINVGNSDWIKVNAFWLIDSNYSNVTKTYKVFDTAGSEFSIWRFFTDFQGYISNENDTDGLFGLKTDADGTSFGLSIIIYIIIFSTAGILSYKFGLNSPAAISAFIFTACLFFEYTTGILDVLPNNSFPILSVTTLIMTIALVIKEVSS